MVRVAPDDVRVLLDTEATDEAIRVAILAANATVEDRIVGHADEPGATTLGLIERFLAAHYLTPSDPEARSVKVGDVTVAYEASPQDATPTRWWGRAVDLDPTGQLDGVQKPDAVFQTFGHDKDDW